ncbi:MAG: hypothetical protein ACJ761_01325 [Chloroflexota bacterium]
MSHRSAARRLSTPLLAALLVASCNSAAAPTGSSGPLVQATLPPDALASVTPKPATPSPTAEPSTEPTPTPTFESTASPTTSSMASTGHIVNKDKGYEITLRSGWRRIDLSKDDWATIFKASMANMSSAQQAAMTAQMDALQKQGIDFIAFRTDDLAKGFGSNLTILSIPSMGLSLDVLAQLNEAQVKNLKTFIHPVFDRVNLPVGEALRIRYDLSVPSATGSKPGSGAIYLWVHGDKQWVMTTTVAGDDAAQEAAGMAKTFRFLK